jgi:hypothetical protein
MKTLQKEKHHASGQTCKVKGMNVPRGKPCLTTTTVSTYLRYHCYMLLLLALTLAVADMLVALLKSLLFLQMCH